MMELNAGELDYGALESMTSARFAARVKEHIELHQQEGISYRHILRKMDSPRTKVQVYLVEDIICVFTYEDGDISFMHFYKNELEEMLSWLA